MTQDPNAATPRAVPAGWYNDPSHPGPPRYWDGSNWSDGDPAAPTLPTTAAKRTGVNPVEAVRLALSRWWDYRGRSSRSEYWWVFLAFLVVSFVLSLVLDALFPGGYVVFPGGFGPPTSQYQPSQEGQVIKALIGLGSIVFMLPLTIRRLHDSGKAWPFLLLGLIPFGGIVLFVLLCLGTEPQVNKWGAPPK